MNKYKQLYAQSMLTNAGLVDVINSMREQNAFNPNIDANFNVKAYTSMLTAKDLILCANRYVWEGLPINLTSQQLEAMFYQWGSLCMFENDKGEVVFSRYTQVGELNPYGLLDNIQPIDLAGKAYDVARAVIHSNQQQELKEGDKFAIIINDYTTLTQLPDELSRYSINSATTIKDQVTVYSQLLTNIIVSVKKALALCESEEQKNVISKQIGEMLDPNKVIVPVSATRKKDGKGFEMPIELFNFANNFDTQNYCQTIDYYDKVRRSFNGIPAPDTFEKKERKITSEAEDTNTHTNLVLIDGLLQRQNGIRLFTKYCKNPNNKNIVCNLQNELRQNFKENADTNEIGDDSDAEEVGSE